VAGIRFPGAPGVGRGPVYPGLGSTHGLISLERDTQFGGPWDSQKVFWYASPVYRGPVLMRGRRLDGPQWLGFDGRKVPARELRIAPGDSVKWQGQPIGSRGIPSSVRALVTGCYGVQIDGASFSRTVVFRIELPT
jgi:hypothetical protein